MNQQDERSYVQFHFSNFYTPSMRHLINVNLQS